jgi:hypothetical protein
MIRAHPPGSQPPDAVPESTVSIIKGFRPFFKAALI